MSSEMIHYRPTGKPAIPFRQWKRNVRALRLVAFFLLLLPFAFGRELFAQSSNTRPAVRMEAIPTRIYQGESLRLQIHLDNFEKFEAPDISYLKETFEVEYLGEQNRNSSMIVIINGKQQKTEEKGMTYNYRLTPKQAGKFRIEPPEIRNGNVVATAFPVSIEVIPPGNQDDIQLKLSASTKEIYPMIPFTLKLEIYVRELPGSLAKNDPVQIIAQQVGLPSLFLPWLEDEQFPKGLAARQNWEDWISKYRNTKGGFIVNNIRAKSAFPVGFSMFDSRWSDAITFLPKGTVVEMKNKDGSKGRFWRYEISRSFFAEKPGDYLFGGASIKGLFAKEDKNNKLVANDVYVLSNPVTVTVKDVPEEGRPDNYIGVFGNFDWKATLAPEKALLGEAMTLTLSLEGNGSLHNIKQPDLEHNPAVTANFKVYKPTEEIKENVARFTYALRPIKEGKVEFPAISVSSFDVEKGKFVTLQTQPISVEVDGNAAAQTMTSGVTPALQATAKTSALSRAAGGIFGNLSDHSGAVNQKITLQDWGKEIALLAGIGFLFWGAVLCLRNDRFIAGRRRSSLLAAAGRQIRESLELLSAGDTRTTAAAASGIRTAFLSPAAECFGKSVSTLTEAEVRNVLNELVEQANGNEPSSSAALRYLPSMANKNGRTSATVPVSMSDEDVQLIKDLRELFTRLEEVQYGFDATTVREIREQSPTLFDRWSDFTAVKKNRKRIRAIVVDLENRKFGNGSSAKSAKEEILKGKNLMLLLALSSFALSSSLLFTGCTAPQNDNAQNEFQRAVKTFEEADSLSEPAGSRKETTDSDKTPGKEKTTARQKELFKKSAAIYQGLIDAGTESGPILYNQGNAWMRAGEDALALAAWRKAKRYMPANAWLNANIETIAPHFQGEKGKPLAEHLLFWQNWISYPVKYRLSTALGIALLFGTIILILLTVGKTKREGESASGAGKNIKWITGILLAFFLVMTCSALYDWYRYDHTKHVIVTESEVIARKGNSLQYNPVFSEPLPKLTDGILLEEQNNWVRVRFSDGQEGWIPARPTVRY